MEEWKIRVASTFNMQCSSRSCGFFLAENAKWCFVSKRQAILDQAQSGAMPTAPDFSKPTHARFRAKLAQIVALAAAGDIAGLQAFEINPVSSSPKTMARYRDLCVIAITARAQVTA